MAVAVGDQIAALVGEEIRPLLKPVLIDAIGVGGDQCVDAQPNCRVIAFRLPFLLHRRAQAPVNARYFFQKPRIAASLARKFCDCASWPPIITTPLPSSLYCRARCTKPPTQPSSIEI